MRDISCAWVTNPSLMVVVELLWSAEVEEPAAAEEEEEELMSSALPTNDTPPLVLFCSPPDTDPNNEEDVDAPAPASAPKPVPAVIVEYGLQASMCPAVWTRTPAILWEEEEDDDLFLFSFDDADISVGLFPIETVHASPDSAWL